MSLDGRPHRREVVDHEHRLILDALTRRDPVDAERYLAGHIRRTRIELAAHPEVFGPPAPLRRTVTFRPSTVELNTGGKIRP